MTRIRRAPGLLVLAGALGCASTPSNPGMPAGTTEARITPADVRSRIYLVAHDSMRGRQAGETGNVTMTGYLAAEIARIGLEPAGEDGTYFQTIPMVRRRSDPQSSLVVNAERLELFSDFVPVRPTSSLRSGTALAVSGAGTVYGGRAGDTTVVLRPDQTAGKIVVLDAPLGSDGKPTAVYTAPTGLATIQFPSAAAVAVTALDLLTPAAKAAARVSANGLGTYADTSPLAILVSRHTAETLMGASLASLSPGATGRSVTARVSFIDVPVAAPARNVIGILRGSDPSLRGQYVAVGAHSDHIAVEARAVDHDSLRAFNKVMRPEGRQTPLRAPTPGESARIRAILDSLRRLAPPRRDSINNGADDDGSGSVAALEIAEAIAAGPRPRRSLLFVWHTAEEGGLLGSSWFVDNPTVSRDSIVAQLNMDMVGRGPDSLRVTPRTIQIIGARRLSTQLGDIVEATNRARETPFRIDYSYDARRHPLNRYCRSDHYNYARRGIPIAYFSRGYHEGYHMVIDEAQYIDFDGLADVADFIGDVAVAIANRPERIAVDGPRMDPRAPCLQ
ncbi:MAG TPA: M28 family peptidase [Gemmatimonadaceae bacterium]|nr:M28 family peptidase [Gemmatimonadaceae bacterium]